MNKKFRISFERSYLTESQRSWGLWGRAPRRGLTGLAAARSGFGDLRGRLFFLAEFRNFASARAPKFPPNDEKDSVTIFFNVF